jgi:hypothetical protein
MAAVQVLSRVYSTTVLKTICWKRREKREFVSNTKKDME